MINHFFVKEYLSFESAQLYFEKGLVVFTGPSGSGKSILLKALLATFGHEEAQAGMSEIEVACRMDLEEYGIESDEVTRFKQLKKGNTRYFVNNQALSKKVLQTISSDLVRFLSHKDYSDFSPSALLEMVDAKVSQKDTLHAKRLEDFAQTFRAYQTADKKLQELISEEQRLTELREFARFELEKITAIDPKIGEDEALLAIKKQLSKKEKITQSIAKAQAIFEIEHKVSEALSHLEVESAFFDDAMNMLRAHFESADTLIEALDEVDIEAVLNRIEAIGELKRRYGSIEEALEYKETKRAQVEKYDHFEEEKATLRKEVATLQAVLMEEADAIHVARMGVLTSLTQALNGYMKALFLRDATITLDAKSMDKTGVDSVRIDLGQTSLEHISSGEFNRLRLGILALKSQLLETQNGILILDEIDANLSGEESMSVAYVLKELAQSYQIFAISHQPQLTSQAHQHFFVYREGEQSCVKDLQAHERIDEIARMISGDLITQEAKQFALKLMGVS